MRDTLVPIERKEGVTLYGRIVNKGGKLGLFEVHSDRLGFDKNVYANYSEAEVRMKALIGVKSSNSFKV